MPYCKIGRFSCKLAKEFEGRPHCFTDCEMHKKTSADIGDFLRCPWPDRQEAEPGAVAYKSPIGVMPKAIWYEKRISDLAGAVKRFVDEGIYDDTVYGWMCELYNTYRERERHLEQKGSAQS